MFFSDQVGGQIGQQLLTMRREVRMTGFMNQSHDTGLYAVLRQTGFSSGQQMEMTYIGIGLVKRSVRVGPRK